MSFRKQLAITDIKAAVLQIAHDIETNDYKKEDLLNKLERICNMLDDEIQVEEGCK